MRRLSSYPRWFFPLLLVILFTSLASGVLLIPTMLEMRMDWSAPLTVSSELRLFSAAIHTLFAFVSMLLLGALSIVHMRMGWRRHQNRISGVGLLVIFGGLLLTAVGMFYFGDEDFSRWASIGHTLAGILITLLFCWHLEKGRRIRLALSSY